MDLKSRVVRAAVCGLLCAGAVPCLWAGDAVEAVQKAASEWAKVRAETVRIESDWEWQRVFMESTRTALQERVERLEERRTQLAAETAADRRDAAALTERRQAMGLAEVDAAKHLRELDEQLVRLRAWLPPRLSAGLELSYRSLAAPELPLGERMQHTMTILNRCLHFNRSIVRGEEAIAIPGGEGRLLEVIYWGLSHGYALDRTAGLAYRGAPGPAGWAWLPAPELTKDVGRLLAVAEDKVPPEFIEVPVQVADPAALNPKS